jgi:hypothetical protein
MARALFAAPGACRVLRAPVDTRTGTVEIVLRRGAYLSFGADWIALADVGAPFGPLSVAVRGIAELGLAPGMEVRTGDGRLVCGDAVLTLERMRERRTTPVEPGSIAGASAVLRAVGAADVELPPVPALLRAGVDAIATGSSRREAVDLLAGLGDGLTPAGDDVLAGYAAWLAVGEEEEARLSTLTVGRSSPLGLAYLRCAERGELPDAAAELLSAIHRGSASAVRDAIPGLCAWGANSGVALAWGLLAAAGHAMDARAARRAVTGAQDVWRWDPGSGALVPPS